MQDIHIDIIGIVAGMCTTISIVPQVVKIWRTRHARDVSMYMFVILSIGIFLWMIYGILLKRIPIILANGASFLLCMTVIVMKIRYDGGAGKQAP